MLPIRSKSILRYISISLGNENKSVVRIEISEIELNTVTDIISVQDIAKKDEMTEANMYNHALRYSFLSRALRSIKAEEIITPSVANADSHRDISKTVSGEINTMRATEINREVMLSCLLDKRNRR